MIGHQLLIIISCNNCFLKVKKRWERGNGLGASIRAASGSKSEALCQTTRGAQTLLSVACDCSDGKNYFFQAEKKIPTKKKCFQSGVKKSDKFTLKNISKQFQKCFCLKLILTIHLKKIFPPLIFFLVTGTECFSDSKTTVVAQARICEGLASELLTPDFNLYFTNTSVVVDCTDILLSTAAGIFQ